MDRALRFFVWPLLTTVFLGAIVVYLFAAIPRELQLARPALLYGIPSITSTEACSGGEMPDFSYPVTVRKNVTTRVVVSWIPIRDGVPQFGLQTGDNHEHFYVHSPGEYSVLIDEAHVPRLPPGLYLRRVQASFEGAETDHYDIMVMVHAC